MCGNMVLTTTLTLALLLLLPSQEAKKICPAETLGVAYFNRSIYVKDNMGILLNRLNDQRPTVPFFKHAAQTIVRVSCRYVSSYTKHFPRYVHRQCGDNTRYFFFLDQIKKKTGKISVPPDLPVGSCYSPIPNIPLSIDNQFDGEGNNLYFANISSIILHCQNRNAALHDSVTIVTQCDSISFGASLHFVCVVVAYLILQPILTCQINKHSQHSVVPTTSRNSQSFFRAKK